MFPRSVMIGIPIALAGWVLLTSTQPHDIRETVPAVQVTPYRQRDSETDRRILEWISLPPEPRTIPFTELMGGLPPEREITEDTIRQGREIEFQTHVHNPKWVRPIWIPRWDPRVSTRWGYPPRRLFAAQRRIYVTFPTANLGFDAVSNLGIEDQWPERTWPSWRKIIVIGATVKRIVESEGEMLVVAKPTLTGYQAIDLQGEVPPGPRFYRLVTENGDLIDFWLDRTQDEKKPGAVGAAPGRLYGQTGSTIIAGHQTHQ